MLAVLITQGLAPFPHSGYEICMPVLLQSGSAVLRGAALQVSTLPGSPWLPAASVPVTFCSHQVDKEFLSCCFMNEACAPKEHKN